MIRRTITEKTSININDQREGEPLERAIERALNNGENLKGDGAGVMYTERKEGVLASTNIRTDRFEIAIDSMGKADASYSAKRDERHNPKVIDLNAEQNETGGQSTQTTE